MTVFPSLGFLICQVGPMPQRGILGGFKEVLLVKTPAQTRLAAACILYVGVIANEGNNVHTWEQRYVQADGPALQPTSCSVF